MADDSDSDEYHGPRHWRVQAVRFLTALECERLLPACVVVYDGADVEDLEGLSRLFPGLHWIVREPLADAAATVNGTVRLFETALARCVLLSRELNPAARAARLAAVRPLRALLVYEPRDGLVVPRGDVYATIRGDPYVYVDMFRDGGNISSPYSA